MSDRKLTHEELEKLIKSYPVKLGGEYVHVKSGNNYFVTNVGYNVTHKQVEVSYFSPDNLKISFFREVDDFLAKFEKVEY